MPKVARVPAYKLHKPTGQARVIIDGRDHYLGHYGSPESREKYGRLIAELGVGKKPDGAGSPRDLLILELAARYWEFAQGYYVKDGRPCNSLYHIKASLRYLREHYGHAPVKEFSPLALKPVRQRIIDMGLTRAYVNKVIGTIVRMFKWGVAEQLVPPSHLPGPSRRRGTEEGSQPRAGSSARAPRAPGGR